MEDLKDTIDDIAQNASDEEGSFSDFMFSIESDMKKLVRESYKAPKDMYEHWQAFSAAINWNERWIQGLLAFHVLLFFIFLLTRNNINIQTAIFFFICILVFLSERINTWCSMNWMSFSTQNYFDRAGVFSGIFFSGPLLLICFFQLLNFLRIASSTLIKVKRMQLAQQQKKKSE